MRKGITWIVMGYLLYMAVAQTACREGAADAKRIGKARQLDSSLTAFSKRSPIPGFAVSIVDEDGVLYSHAFGVSDRAKGAQFTPETVHCMASVSKTIVALCVLKLVEEGRLKLNEPINAILPFPIVNPYFPDQPIRVAHLLDHTSGVIDDGFVPYYIGEADISLLEDQKKYDSFPPHLLLDVQYYRMGKPVSLETYIRNYTRKGARWYSDSTFLHKAPGTYFQYSNLAASIAALIVEKRSGMSFREFSRKVVFEPLQLKNTAWDYDSLHTSTVTRIYAQEDPVKDTAVREFPFHYMLSYPVSELKSNAVDLGLFLSEMIRGYEGKGRLLSNEMYRQLFQPGEPAAGLNRSDSSRFNTNYSHAAFWAVSATGYRMHFGGRTGTYAFIYFNPNTRRGALAYANLRHESFGDLLELVADAEQQWE